MVFAERQRVWCGRKPAGGSYLPKVDPIPGHLNWDLWVGPAPFHDYNPGYVGSCLRWNRFWDFGSGQIGDMGSHMIDLAYWALDLRFPTSCEAEGTPLNSDTCPRWLVAHWDHPANDWRPAVKLHWYDGGKQPTMPSGLLDPKKLFKGVIFTGDKGHLLCDYGYRVLFPSGDMTQYTAPTSDTLIPRSPGMLLRCFWSAPALDLATTSIPSGRLSSRPSWTG